MRKLDCRGRPNPEPVLALAQVAAKLGPSESIEVLTDDPCATSDFLRWAASTGMLIVDIKGLPGGALQYRFQRRRAARRPKAGVAAAV